MGEINLNRAIIIGLGSTGLKILESFQNLWYEKFSNVSTSFVKLYNIESDRANIKEKTALGSMIEQIFIPGGRNSYSIIAKKIQMEKNPLEDNFRDKKRSQRIWDFEFAETIPWDNVIGFTGSAGAGGIRAGGKLLLWNENPDTRVRNGVYIFEKIKRFIGNWGDVSDPKIKDEILEDLNKNNNLNLKDVEINKKILVYIVGSLTGGTCSGTFLDIADLMKELLNIPDNELQNRLIGIFMIPPNDKNLIGCGRIDYHSVSANSFGALYEQQQYVNEHNVDGISNPYPPYTRMFLCAPEYNTHNPQDQFTSIDGLAEMVALKIFTNLLASKSETENDGVDEDTLHKRGYLHSFGIGGIYYPKDTMAEYMAQKVLYSLIDRLIDDKGYYPVDKRDKISFKGIENDLKRETEFFLEKVFKEVFESINDTFRGASIDLDEKINELVTKIKDNEINKQELINDFSSNNGFFKSNIEKNTDNAKNIIEKKLSEFILAKFEKSMNLHLIVKTLQSLKKAIKQSKKLFEEQWIDDFSKHPDKYVGEIFEQARKKNIKFSFDKKKQIKGMLLTLFDNFVYSYIYDYIKILKDKRDEYYVVFENDKSILSALREEIKRKSEEIKSRLDYDPRYSPVIKVFKKTKEEDCDHFWEEMTKLYSNDKRMPDWEKLGKISPEKLLKFLKDNPEELGKSLLEVKEKLKEIVIRNINNYLKDFDLINKIIPTTEDGKPIKKDSKWQKFSKENFAKIKGGFLRLNDYYKSKPLDFLFTNHDKGIGLINEFELPQNTKIVNSNVFFNNMLLFEHINSFISLKDLQVLPQLKNAFLRKRDDIEDISDEIWQRLRLTRAKELDYTIVEAIKKSQIDDLLKFIELFYLIEDENGEYHYNDEADYPIISKESFIFEGKDVFLHFRVPGSGAIVKVKINSFEHDSINKLCKEDIYFNIFKDLILSKIQEGLSNPVEYINKLCQFYEKYISPRIKDKDVDNEEHYKDVFGEYRPDDSLPIDEQRKEIKKLRRESRALIGRIWQIVENEGMK